MKFHSQPIPEHQEVPQADQGRWEEVVDYWSGVEVPGESGAYVLTFEGAPTEILALVEAQGDAVVGHETYKLRKARPRTLIGPGTAREVADRARQSGARILVVDAELSPSQLRNLEDAAGIPICDREAIILNVFLRHARSRQARVQVEIARLEYLRPRIRGVGIDMDQQMGGVSGSRGPGETASELLARKLDSRLAELRRVQKRIGAGGALRREQREGCPRLALVGYTNAGKTSLMNALTGEQLSAADRPFETLDTTSRALSRHGGEVLISDTVGFVRNLPERLLESFQTTLAEIREASLLVMVVDCSDPDWRLHLETTTDMLVKLEAESIPRFYVYNKIDLVTELPELPQDHPSALVCSRDPVSVEALKQQLLATARLDQPTLEMLIPYEAEEALSMIYGRCRVLSTRSTEEGLWLSFQGEPDQVARIERLLR